MIGSLGLDGMVARAQGRSARQPYNTVYGKLSILPYNSTNFTGKTANVLWGRNDSMIGLR